MWIDRRWLMLGLGVSLLANIFLVGVVSGRAFGGHDGGLPGGRPPQGGPLVPDRQVRALQKDQRKLFNTSMAAHRATIKAARQEVQRLRQLAEADIAAPTFDSAKVAADLKAMRDAQTTMQTAIHEALVEGLGKLEPASRSALVEHVNESVGNAPADHH